MQNPAFPAGAKNKTYCQVHEIVDKVRANVSNAGTKSCSHMFKGCVSRVRNKSRRGCSEKQSHEFKILSVCKTNAQWLIILWNRVLQPVKTFSYRFYSNVPVLDGPTQHLSS